MRRKTLVNLGIYLLVAVFLAVGLVPFLWIISTSLKIPREYFSWPPQWIPSTLNWKNYTVLFTQYRFSGKLTNSLLVAGGTTLISVFAGAAGAYAMSRFRTGGRTLASWLVIQRMAPPMTVVIALYFMAAKLRISNSPFTLILAHTSVSLPFCIWMLKGFFDEIPMTLDEAAAIDGATRFQALRLVILPLIGPGLAASAIFTLIQSWNEFLFAVILMNSDRTQTLPVAIANFITPQTEVQFGPMAAATIIATVPVFVFSLFIQKYLVKGLTSGAVKG